MMLILTIVGVVVAFGVGFAFGHAGRPLEPEVTASASAVGSVSLADLLEGHPTGVVIGDRHGAVEYRNSAALALAGTHVGVLLDEAIERHLGTARDGTTSDEVLEVYGPPRAVLMIEARALPTGGSVVFVDDISERRRMDQVRTDFVANISHELKTPIGAISVLAETLVEEDDPETIARVVERMMAESQRATRTVDDLMELSRIELGSERALEAVALSDVVSAAVGRVAEFAKQRGIRVSTLDPVDPNEPPRSRLIIQGDRTQLVSAVGNLVENAVKYSEPDGLVQVRVRVDADVAEIMVADQGVGIPQRDLDRIFERFYRVDRARSRATGGTGLGLSIVRHVATNHGGEVVVSSTEGEGSTFVLRVPIRSKPSSGGDVDGAPVGADEDGTTTSEANEGAA